MQVINIHKRLIDQPRERLLPLIETLASKNDKIWPKEHWPSMKLDKGLQKGSSGGHGPIGYTITRYQPGTLIEFQFTHPKTFKGHHRFEIAELSPNLTELQHTIDMQAQGHGILAWSLAIRWLHDALIEDAFDKVENHFLPHKKKTPWNIWVKLLRYFLK